MTAGGRFAAFGAALIRWLTNRRAPVAVGDAPAAWLAYAERVSRRLQEALDGADAAARRVRAQLDCHADTCVAAGDAAPALRLRAWLDTRGRVMRVETSPPAGPAIDAALRAALVGRPVGASPPRRMRQPLVVRLRCTTAPPAPDEPDVSDTPA